VTDERPLPQYGEYATPEQQAAAMGIEYVPADQKEPQASSTPASALAHPAPSPRDVVRDIPAPAGAVARRSPRPYDRFFTYVLLGVATYSLISGIPDFVNFAGVFSDQLVKLGLPEYSQPALAGQIGIALLVSQAVLYALTFWLAIRQMRRGRPAFFIPVLGAIVFLIISCVLFLIAFHADPAIWAKVATGSFSG
jgi:hypothetical protein